MSIILHQTEGLVAELNGQYWGIVWDDGHSTEYGFTDISDAIIKDTDCNSPIDFIPHYKRYPNSPYVRELSMARLLKVKKQIVLD
jgi:hypothetical protein